MPFRSPDSGYSQYSVQREEPRPAPGFSETVTAAFKMENDVLNAYEHLTAPDYLPDPEFDLGRNLKEKGLWELRDDYLGVRSAQEMDYRTNQIQAEQKNRQTLAEAGWGGVVASIAAGAASPITFVPLIGPGLKGAKAVAYSASLAAMSAGAQEGVLFTSQQTRTGEEAAFSVAASTILGGILGGAVGMMKRADFDELSSRMGTSNNDEAILEPVQGANAGAAFVVRDATGGLKSGAGNKLAFIGPVTRLHAQKASPTAKSFINEFADAGLKMENAVAAAPGGNIESMIKTYALYDVKGITSLDEEFSNYTLTGPGMFRNLRADLASWTQRGKMNRAEFNEEVTKAGWSGDVHPDKFVQAAAQRLRKEVYDPILKEAQEVGLLPKDIDLKGDLSYISRMYDTRLIKAKKNDFIDILAAHFEKKLADEFQERFVKFSEKTARDQELIADLGRTREEADALRAQFEEELRAVDEEIPEHVRILSDDIAVLKQQLRQIPDIEERGTPTPGVKSPAELRAQLRAEIAQLKEQGGEALSGFETRTKEVKRRLKSLNQSRVVMQDKQAAKLERLERIDELSLSSLNRAVRAAGRFLRLLDKTNDKALDKEISKLKTTFAQAAEIYDKGEEKLVKLAADTNAEDFKKFFAMSEENAPRIPKERSNKVVGYHGSRQVIEDFDPSQTHLGRGIFFSEDPKLASRFAMGEAVDNDPIAMLYDDLNFDEILAPYLTKAQEKEMRAQFAEFNELEKTREMGADFSPRQQELYDSLMKTSREASAVYEASPNVTRTNIDLGKTYEYTFKKGFDWDEEAQAIQHAKDNGFDSVTFIIDADGKPKEKFYSVFNDYQVLLPKKQREAKVAEDLKKQMGLQAARGEKMSDLTNKLEQAETFDRQAWKEAVDQLLNESLERVQNINLRRGARAQRLREGLEGVDPKLVDERIAKVANRVKERSAGLADLYRDKGDDVDLESGTANFSGYARDLAEDTTNNILKMNSRIQFNDLIKEKRGPEVARMLDIPSIQMAEFLEKNAEKNLRLYVKTMGSDISIMRRTGSTNAQKFFDDLENEHNAKTAALKTAVDKEGNPLSPEKMEQLQNKINKEYNQNYEDMITVLERARRQRGVPDNPDGWAERGAALVMNLNTLRYMGGVTISSIPDIGRPIMKYGLTRVFRDGFGAMIRDLKTVRMSQREGLLAGVAGTDPVLHSRAFAFSEITDTYGRGTKLERAVQYATNKIGVLALFDYWTSAWKSFTSGLVNAEMLENISIVMEGGSAKQLAKANHYLASVNLSPDLIETVWQQVQKGGGAKINGIWLPQTERWDMADPQVRRAKRAYYAAMAKEVDDTIITPGFERPSVVDKNLPWKMLFQFKSFAMSSTTKTLMAGLQEDGFKAKFLTGTMVSLAFGALSYYLWAVAAGGKAYQEMLNADIDKWADEAIARAGITGAGDIAHSFAQRIPGLQPYTSFSGTRSSRREGGDISEAILGPSFDFLEKTGGVLTGIDDPTQGTLRNAFALAPLRNHFGLRQGFDAIIANSGLPERRE